MVSPELIGQEFTLQCKICRAESTKKPGSFYDYVDAVFPNGYTKRLFLDDSEYFLISLANSSNINNSTKGEKHA